MNVNDANGTAAGRGLPAIHGYEIQRFLGQGEWRSSTLPVVRFSRGGSRLKFCIAGQRTSRTPRAL